MGIVSILHLDFVSYWLISAAMQRREFAATRHCFGTFTFPTISFLDLKIEAGRFMRESIISFYGTVYSSIDCAELPVTSLTVMDAIVSVIYVCLAWPRLQLHTGTQCAVQVSGLNGFIFLYILFYWLQKFFLFTAVFLVMEVSLKFDWATPIKF
jgi:hypothetical protein